DLPELGTLSRRQIAALVGVAPSPESPDRGEVSPSSLAAGQRSAPLSSWPNGRSASQPSIRDFRDRLVARGKPRMVACMGNLLTILNAILRDQTPWKPA